MGDRPPGDAPFHLKVAAGLTTGGLAIAIASPTDLVKVGTAKQYTQQIAFVLLAYHIGFLQCTPDRTEWHS